MILAEPDGGAHRGMTEVGDAPAPGTRDFGDEPADVESFEQAGDVRTVPAVGVARVAYSP